MSIRIVNMYTKIESGQPIDTTSKGGRWAGLSPFNIGPCQLYGGRQALVHENAWQYTKLYAQHADDSHYPTDEYWRWAEAGWANPQAMRYPMGKGAVPLGSFWSGRLLSYIDARKRIYAPLYIAGVQQTESFQAVKQLHDAGVDLVFRDYDGYDHDALGMSLTDVLNNPRRKMGHAFVLKMLLTNDAALQCFLASTI